MSPLCVVAQKGDEAETGSLDAFVRANWNGWGLEGEPGKLNTLLLTGGRRSNNKVVGLVFQDGGHKPSLVVKWPRTEATVEQLAREGAALDAVHSAAPGGLTGVPRKLFLCENGHAPALGESYLGGQPVFVRLHKGNYRSIALRATAWLERLAAGRDPRPRSEWWGRLVEPVLADFERSFGVVVDPAMLGRTREILLTLRELPLVCEQRDFSPWNVLLDGRGGLVVLDWESAELRGLPLLDLTYFLAYLAFFYEKAAHSGRYRESYRACLTPSTFPGSVLTECFRRYTIALNLPLEVCHPLRVFTWMLHSRSEIARMRADHGEMLDRARLRRSLFVGLWEEELQHGYGQ